MLAAIGGHIGQGKAFFNEGGGAVDLPELNFPIHLGGDIEAALGIVDMEQIEVGRHLRAVHPHMAEGRGILIVPDLAQEGP